MAGLGQNSQYYYSPDVTAWINSASTGKIINISEDIISFSISRVLNATSTAQLFLSNNAFKYTPGSNNNFTLPPITSTMDEIIISLKRETYYEYFTGFVTYCPIVTLIPSAIELQCSCTLYKAQNSYWDAGAIEVDYIIPSVIFSQGLKPQTYQDGGIGQGIYNLLTEVCNWNKNDIHIGAIPQQWMNFAINTWIPLEEEQKQSTDPYVMSAESISNFLTSTGQTSSAIDGSTLAFKNPKSNYSSVVTVNNAPQGTAIPGKKI